MKILEILLWMLWLLTLLSLTLSVIFQEFEMRIPLFFTCISACAMMYLLHSQKRRLTPILLKLDRVNLTPIKLRIEELRKEQTTFLLRTFKLEMMIDEQKKELEKLREEFEKLPRDQEMKYRETVRKVLDLENKMNKKFKLLGEAILKISKERERKV